MSWLGAALRLLGAVLGEDGYARYCDHLRRQERPERIPSRREFYLESLERRYSRPGRCC